MWASTIVVLCSFATAQTQLPEDPKERAHLCETVVQRWEKAMSELDSFEAAFDRTIDDPFDKSKTVVKGTARYLKGEAGGNPNRWSFVCNEVTDPKRGIELKASDSKVFVINRDDKEVVVVDRKVKVPFVGQIFVRANKAINFALGKKEAVGSFAIQLTEADKNYFYLELRPKQSSESNIRFAQIALNRATCIPRTIRIVQMNSTDTQWDFHDVKTAVQLRPADFEGVPAPDGWRVIEFPEFEGTLFGR